jgi:hypothetical protein
MTTTVKGLEPFARTTETLKITQWYDNWMGEKTRGADEFYTPNRDDALEWYNTQEKCVFIMDLTGLSARDHSPRYFDRMIDIIESAYLQLLQVNGIIDDPVRIR